MKQQKYEQLNAQKSTPFTNQRLTSLPNEDLVMLNNFPLTTVNKSIKLYPKWTLIPEQYSQYHQLMKLP